MSYPRVRADVTAETRAHCERDRPNCRGSVHPCASCGTRVPWAALRWLLFEGWEHPVPVHDCPKHPLPEFTNG